MRLRRADLRRASEAVKKSSCRGGPCGRPRATIPRLRDPYDALPKRNSFTASLAFRPMSQPRSSSKQAGRLSLPACLEEVLQDARPTGRQSLPARQAAEPQVVADRIEGNLDKLGQRPPLRYTS
jgi:hypothetical protein